jgi:peptidoglycan hydrolase CwlO-like protein
MSDISIQALRDRIGVLKRLIDRDRANREGINRDKDKLLKQISVLDSKISIYSNSINKKQAEIADIKKDIDDLQAT